MKCPTCGAVTSPVKSKRQLAGLTQKQMAQFAGCTQGMWSRIESSKEDIRDLLTARQFEQYQKVLKRSGQ